MATRIDSLTPRRNGRNGPKYPLNDWLDGTAWLLTRGEDFECSPNGIKSLLIYHAGRRGLTIETRMRGNTLEVQAGSREPAGSR